MKIMMILAAFYGMTAVILGAFGAHALKEALPPERLQSFETGVRYQLVHAVMLLAVAGLMARPGGGGSLLVWCGWLTAAGILLFAGSIYLLATRELTGLTHYRWLGPVTPLGGLSMILGWALLLVYALRLKT